MGVGGGIGIVVGMGEDVFCKCLRSESRWRGKRKKCVYILGLVWLLYSVKCQSITIRYVKVFPQG